MSDKPIKFDAEMVDSHLVDDTTIEQEQLIGEQSLEQKDKQLPSQVNLKLKSSKKNKGLASYFVPALSALVVFGASYEAYSFVESLLARNPILGSFAGILLLITVISGGWSLINNREKKKRLQQREKIQQKLAQSQLGNGFGQVESLLQQVNQEIGQSVDISQLETRYQLQKQANHNDAEIIQIYSDTVLSGLDKLAMDVVSKHASECAAMVALSPLAAADMALVAWRSSKMIQELSTVYGCSQTTFGRLGLSKQVLTNLMLAGASELVADAGVELLGKSLTATVSAQVAQGIGVGLLVSRMGIQTMRLCRPVAFNEQNRPKISQLRKSISGKVIAMLKSKNTDNNSQKKDD